MKDYLWHGISVKLAYRPSYKKGIKRNCTIILPSGKGLVVPCRALRLPK